MKRSDFSKLKNVRSYKSDMPEIEISAIIVYNGKQMVIPKLYRCNRIFPGRTKLFYEKREKVQDQSKRKPSAPPDDGAGRRLVWVVLLSALVRRLFCV